MSEFLLSLSETHSGVLAAHKADLWTQNIHKIPQAQLVVMQNAEPGARMFWFSPFFQVPRLTTHKFDSWASHIAT